MFNTSERPDCLGSLVLHGLIFYRFYILSSTKRVDVFAKIWLFLHLLSYFSQNFYENLQFSIKMFNKVRLVLFENS